MFGFSAITAFFGVAALFIIFVVLIGLFIDSPADEQRKQLENERLALEIEQMRNTTR